MQFILSQWLKPDGSHVEVGEHICTIMTENSESDLTAHISGTLHHLKGIGQELHFGETPARIDPDEVQPS